jgi:hypothetical protein
VKRGRLTQRYESSPCQIASWSTPRLAAELQQRATESVDYYLEGTLQMALLLAGREQYRLGDCEALNVGSREMVLRSANGPMLIWYGCRRLRPMVVAFKGGKPAAETAHDAVCQVAQPRRT